MSVKRILSFLGRRRCWVYCLMLIMLSVSGSVFAQKKYTIKGKVFAEADMLEVIGASVQVDGTTTGTVTDFDGNFSIEVTKPKGTLVISYVGCQTARVAYNQQKNNLKVILREDTKLLDEVVVVGYGSMRKKEVTGAVSRVSADELQKITTSDIGTALQGLVAGVNVQASSGEPGAKSNIQIRGLSSISGSNAPLYVVDGVPYEGDPGLSSSEIESIDVLKDAASAAIYGTRGAAGVILITTKQGKAGEMKVSVNGSYGIQHITSTIDLVNAAERTFLNVLKNRNSESGVNDTDDRAWTSLQNYPSNFFNDSNLYDVIINNNSPVQNYSVNLSGGKNDLTYSLTANYFNQEGVLINSNYSTLNLRSNTTFKRGKWTVNTSLGFKLEDQMSPGWGLLTQSYNHNPTSTAIDPDQEITTAAGQETEISNLSYTLARVKETNDKGAESFNGNFNLAYDIIKGLNISTRLGFDYTNSKTVKTNPLFEIYNDKGELSNNSERSGITNTHYKSSKLTWETMLNWGKKFGKHDVKATGVFSMEQYKYVSFTASIMDLYTNYINSLYAGTADMAVSIGQGQWGQDRTTSLVGMLGRVQYNYGGRYMASASVRRDGSSKFSPQNRWGMFPSVSAGWNISEEAFWKPLKKTINSFKFRASYGTTGNQNFADYSFQNGIYKNYDYVFGQDREEKLYYGFAENSYANPDVVWETTQQINVGLDLGLLNNKFNVTLDWYNSDKKDMLFPLLVPPTNGTGISNTMVLNAGNMRNRGYELSVRHRSNFKGLYYDMSFNFSTNENTITKMGGENEMYYFADGQPVTSNTADKVTVIKEGYEAGAFFVMPTNGIINTEQKLAEYQKLNSNARMGDLIYVDRNGDGIISDDDRVYGGSGMPEYELSYNIWMGYKGFDFSMNWYASLGNEIINGSKIYAYQSMTHKDLLYQWSPTNPTSTIPSYRSATHDNYRSYADIWVEDGSFVRLKNITLGYTIPQRLTLKWGINKLRFYVAADNLVTLTKYSGYDPEVGSNGLSKRGLDLGTYPISMQMRGGFQLNF